MGSIVSTATGTEIYYPRGSTLALHNAKTRTSVRSKLKSYLSRPFTRYLLKSCNISFVMCVVLGLLFFKCGPFWLTRGARSWDQKWVQKCWRVSRFLTLKKTCVWCLCIQLFFCCLFFISFICVGIDFVDLASKGVCIIMYEKCFEICVCWCQFDRPEVIPWSWQDSKKSND